MTSVLDYIHQHALFLGSWGGFAKSLGLLLALCVTSYECWMMMLGRRGIDVMKLLRIVGLSLCIVSANAIADTVAAPGEKMGQVMKAQATISHKRIDALENTRPSCKASTSTSYGRITTRWTGSAEPKPSSQRTPTGGRKSPMP